MNMDILEKINKGKFSLPVITKIADKLGIPYILNDTYSGSCAILMFEKGSFVVWDSPFNINASGSIKICSNKDICTSFLQRIGFSTPKSINYTRETTKKNNSLYEPMLDFFKNVPSNGFKYPLIIKPSTLSQGIGITKVNNFNEASEAIKISLESKSRTFIIQEYIEGNDFRIVVLGDKVIQAYKRVPFHIVGNGINSVKELLESKVKEFIENDRDKKVDKNDERILKCIKDKGYDLDSVLEEGKTLNLQNIANLSLGGTSVDYTNQITPFFKNVAVKIAKALNLDMCGIDIITSSIDDENNKDYKILEVNSAPGLDNYLYDNELKQEKYVESLYEEVIMYIKNKVDNREDKIIKVKTKRI